MKSVAIRADASVTIGTGHVMRCLALATLLRDAAMNVSFICREHEGHLADLIAERGFHVVRLPQRSSSDHREDGPHAAWLGSTWQEDADQTRAAVVSRQQHIDWLVVDHYALDARWESALRGIASGILVIDDLADRNHDCDVLLDQNIVGNMFRRHEDRIPPHCRALLGPRYAILDASYLAARPGVRPRQGPIRRLLVFFGADPHNLTGAALDEILDLCESRVAVDVVVGHNSSMVGAIRAQTRDRRHVQLHHSLPSLAPLMSVADLAIGACGSSTWERMCVGLPSIVVSTAENQRPIAAELHRRGLVNWIGHLPELAPGTFRTALSAHLARGSDEDWSRRCMAEVDGRGAARVLAVLNVEGTMAVTLRQARAEDEALLLEWANEPETRRNSFSPDPIAPEAHHTWFRQRLALPDACRFLIAEDASGRPVGQIRFDVETGAWRINYAVAPGYRGRGLGRRLVELGVRHLRRFAGASPVRLVAAVRSSNLPSRRVFESLGFEAAIHGDVLEYHRDA